MSLASVAQAASERYTVAFAPCGNSYSAAIFADNPVVGRRVIAVNIILNIEVFAGSNAADFATDLLIPLDPDPGRTNVFVATGQSLGFSGAGFFSYTEYTERFNGVVRAGRYGAETFGTDCRLLPESRLELVLESTRCPADLDDGSGAGTPDNAVTLEDLLYFLGQYESGALAADLDNGTGTGTPDGGVTVEDLLYFLDRYGAGC